MSFRPSGRAALDLVEPVIMVVRGLKAGSDCVVFTVHDAVRGVGDLAAFVPQDCCNNGWLEEFDGPGATDLVGARILSVDVVGSESKDAPAHGVPDESVTWTFVKLHTTAGTLHMRWCGTSNGYYGEEAGIFVGSSRDESGGWVAPVLIRVAV